MSALQVLNICVTDGSDVQCYVQALEWMDNGHSVLGALSPSKSAHNLLTFSLDTTS